jgi:predicted phosphohydrolase
MALYAIGDLHLCLGAHKPMDIFGGAWVGYMDKLKEGLSVITQEDTTVLLGDLSWSLDLPNAKADFAWINEIPGKKIILKGNHDYWWSTAAKFYKFCQENGYENMVDACTIIKSLGVEAHMVPGNRGNIKVTTPEDVYIFRALLQYKENEQIFGYGLTNKVHPRITHAIDK